MPKQSPGKSRGPGRRPGAPDTRGGIVDAARQSFASRGYDATTVRGVAREAGVDPALVHHYFASKHELFVAAMDLPVDPEAVLARVVDGDLATMGERLVRAFLGFWENPESRTRMTAFIRSVTTNEDVARMLREALSTVLFERVGPRLDRPDAPLRITAVGSQLIGLAMARYVVCLEPIASTDLDDVVRIIAPTVQRYLTADL